MNVTDLPKREREVLTLLSDGLTNRDISDRLGVSERTVANIIATLYIRLDVDNRVSAARWFLEHDGAAA